MYWQSPKQPLLNVSLFYDSLCLFVDQAEPWTRCFKNLIIIIHCPHLQSVSQSSCRTTTAYLDLHRCVLCVPIKTKAFHLIETHASCVPGQLLLPLPVVVLLHSSVAKKIKYLCPSVSVLSTSSSSYRYGHKVTHRRRGRPCEYFRWNGTILKRLSTFYISWGPVLLLLLRWPPHYVWTLYGLCARHTNTPSLPSHIFWI